MKDHPQREKELRQRLEIPPDAHRVLVFGETSHWDPNWLYTSEEYFKGHCRETLDIALEELIRDPKRIYSLECVFFLQMYWDRFPEKQEMIRQLVNEGRIRFTGSGITTPDTTLPETEAILRDYLYGQAWLEQHGMNQQPRLAYFPDGFGHSPGVPALLAAAGFDYCSITRIDGMNFPATDYRRSWYYPRPGSNAWLLTKELNTVDFYWRSPDRSQVLTHWNAFTYFQGDNLTYVGPIKWMGKLYGLPIRSERHVARRIASYVKQLAPLSRTPYMYCPIGMDFNRPIPALRDLFRRYNQKRYPHTGVYVLLAGMDDYLDLVSCHASKIPALQLDFNPYWMGFYSTRPRLKQRIKNLTRDLIKTEKLFFLAQETKGQEVKAPDLKVPWENLILSNHHDFITGTSPDRVVDKEQKALVTQSRLQVKRALHEVLAKCEPPPLSPRGKIPHVTSLDQRCIVENDFYQITLDSRAGGGITHWIDKNTGREMLAGIGNDLILYEDTGGLWRLGHEFAGGCFRMVDRASHHRASLDIDTDGPLLEITNEISLGGKRFIRHLWFRDDSPTVRMKVDGSLPAKRTLTVRYATVLSPRSLHMDVPGGVVDRPCEKLFNPTFWPAKSFVHVKEQESDRGMAVSLYCPATVSGNVTGIVEWIAVRNAPRETAFGCLPVLAHPASGQESGDQWLDYAVWFTSQGGWADNRVPLMAERALRPSWLHPGKPDRDTLADSLIIVEGGEVTVEAIKEADLGGGLIVRLGVMAPFHETVRLSHTRKPIQAAWLCTAREKNVRVLEVRHGVALVPMTQSICTVRLKI